MAVGGPLSGMFEVAGTELRMKRPEGSVMRMKAKIMSVTATEHETHRGIRFRLYGDPAIPMNAQVAETPSGTIDITMDENYTGRLAPGMEFWVDLTPKEEFDAPRLSGWTCFMKRMGFSEHPGELPFATIRSQKWANYTWVGEIIEIHGEHNCNMKAQAARVTKIERCLPDHEVPKRLAHIPGYKKGELYLIWLEAVDEEDLRRIGLRQSPPS